MPIREHSRKPDEQYELIEKCSFGERLELFARGPREGWTRAWPARGVDRLGQSVGPLRARLANISKSFTVQHRSSDRTQGKADNSLSVFYYDRFWGGAGQCRVMPGHAGWCRAEARPTPGR